MTTSQSNLRQLLLACRLGNEQASRELWRVLFHQLSACANAILRDDHLAHDAVQNAFLKLLQTHKRKVREIENPIAWMLTLTRNEALQLLRKHKRVHARQHQGDIDPGNLNQINDNSPTLSELLNALPVESREIITLKHACSLTFDQAALVLNENRNTLAARYKRAIDQLRELHAPNMEATQNA